MTNRLKKAVIAFAVAAVLLPAAVPANTADSWEFGASIYGWFPDISGQTSFPYGPGGGSFDVEVGDIIDNLDFTLQGSFDARRGSWGLFTDVIYMDLGNGKSEFREGTIGGMEIPVDASASVDLDMKSWIWTTAGYYRVLAQPEKTFDLLAGFRYADIEQTLDWNFSGNVGQIPLPGRQGNAKVAVD